MKSTRRLSATTVLTTVVTTLEVMVAGTEYGFSAISEEWRDLTFFFVVAFKMYNTDGFITEEQFLNITDALHRFSVLNSQLTEEKRDYIQNLFKTLLNKHSK